ncbi:unnamed protein product [Discula destructiva]
MILQKNVPDDRQSNPGHTLFTSPGATKATMLNAMRSLVVPTHWKNAVVLLASPAHASWLVDQSFMARLIRTLQHPAALAGNDTKINILAAVVDGLHPRPGSPEMREGLSLQLGSLHGLLPGLWDEASDEAVERQSGPFQRNSESAHVSVILRTSKQAGSTVTVNLPLANTLFHNGRRTTCLASEWQLKTSDNGQMGIDLLRMKGKRTQTIDLPVPSEYQNLPLHSPLVPITYPRKIVEGLGNILAKVEIEGQPSPASKEIQVNIPRLLEARRAWSEPTLNSGRVGVWALIIPQSTMELGSTARSTTFSASQEASAAVTASIRSRFLGAAVGKLAFEFTTLAERTAWQRCNALGDLLLQGGRLHKILSGGGEWGAKASLLSLDPQTSLGVESEEDELDRFQRSFNGEDTAEEAITRPGDYVQFFVEGDSDVPAEHRGHMELLQAPDSYPVATFGVGEFRKEDYATAQVEDSLQAQQGLVQMLPDHFGAFSAEGLYLDMLRDGGDKRTMSTKVDTPGTYIGPLATARPTSSVVDLSASQHASARSASRPANESS